MHWNKMVKRISLGALASAALLSVVGVSVAAAGPYSNFAECPTENAKVTFCLYSKTVGGEVKIGTGSTKVPIVNPIQLQGGYYVTNHETGAQAFVGAKKGVTLEPVAQPVPGGLADLVNCTELSEPFKAACKLIFENKITGVNATAELAKPASSIMLSTNNLINGIGVALLLPVKIHLENPFLGSKCYIGSESKPLNWNLTTGTTSPKSPNKPISGLTGTVFPNPVTEVVQVTGSELVDNAFSAPGASGCGGFPLEYLLDPIIEAKLGLPAADGYNTVKLDNNSELVTVETLEEQGIVPTK